MVKDFVPAIWYLEDPNNPEKHISADNRTCPCPQAINEEIPNDGKCHCGIFCTPEFVATNS